MGMISFRIIEGGLKRKNSPIIHPKNNIWMESPLANQGGEVRESLFGTPAADPDHEESLKKAFKSFQR
jgi:hypothetical protein